MRLDQASVELSDLVSKILSGRLDIQPDFQRGQVWNESKKKRLIDTILREWYVPAIHIVVNDDLGSDEVLDGQQRVRSILDFVQDVFPVDGSLEPADPSIQILHGSYYSDLPPKVRSKFNKYSLGTIRLRDFSPNEPGELFFRLNQNTSLTAAEQRNALIGEPRNQVRRLAGQLENALSGLRIGFSNARMNYDDVIARLAMVYENGRLTEKITAADLERRYRSDEPFSRSLYEDIEESIFIIAKTIKVSDFQFKFNKASLFSWLLFARTPYYRIFSYPDVSGRFLSEFEFQRYSNLDFENEFELTGHSPVIDYFSQSEMRRDRSPQWIYSLRVFSDRASSRVNDVSSIILRDLMLHIACADFTKRGNYPEYADAQANGFIDEVKSIIPSLPDDISDRSSFEHYLVNRWGDIRAIR